MLVEHLLVFYIRVSNMCWSPGSHWRCSIVKCSRLTL